jgi:uncharacterized protein
MSGENNLQVLLSTMEPVLDENPFGFVSLSPDNNLLAIMVPFAVIREDEGVTIIMPLAVLNQHNLTSEAWAKISLTIHSSLSAVGLTAAIATALGKENISANVVAGYYHDHFFVQWDRRYDALKALAAFKA